MVVAEDYSDPKRAAKPSLGLLVWCVFSHFLAETQRVELWLFHGLAGMYWLENIQDGSVFNSLVTQKPGGLYSTLM